MQAIEARWREAWNRARCFRAPARPEGAKFFNYDSGPFPSGSLHMGHVRTYVLGDVTARYARLLGKSVLYATEWDAFGLPNELAAQEAGMSPRELTARSIALMKEQLRALGISYDWSRVRSTADDAYVRGTQALFLHLLRRGLVDRRTESLPFCPACATTLARNQTARDTCWRCACPLDTRETTGYVVAVSRYADDLALGLGRLAGWSDPARALLRSLLAASSAAPLGLDWPISRTRSWGTPIPVIHCPVCGAIPVREADLPVLLPADLDWSAGPHPLSRHAGFLAARCPRCASAARRDSDTLDCFFDDIWCFLACLIRPGLDLLGARESLAAWLPVDAFHGGLDTFQYLHLHRVLGLVLRESGTIADADLIRSWVGHEMVLAGGRKMSKHLGNAVSPEKVLGETGADALRVGILRAAAPLRSISWRDEIPERASRFLARIHELYARSAAALAPGAPRVPGTPSRALRALASRAEDAFRRTAGFIEEYRPNAAVDELDRLAEALSGFALHRLDSARLSSIDAADLRRILLDYASALSPFAPHLAEECRALLGEAPFAALARWPAPAGGS